MPFESLTFAMLSDLGRVRRRNEDACAADVDHGVFVVCDGVGGAAGGEIASRLAADSFVAHLVEMRKADLSSEVAMHNGIEHANRLVYRQSSQAATLRGMATTLVGLYFEAGGKETGNKDAASSTAGSTGAETPSSVWLGNVGDSRCYRLRDGELTQLTLDHSVVEEQVRAGEMTREQAERSPIRNVITRAVGSDARVAADVHRIDVDAGDIFLLSSDGLTRELANAEIAVILCAIEPPQPFEDEPASNVSLAEAAVKLVAAANKNGGGDNITCVIIHVG